MQSMSESSDSDDCEGLMKKAIDVTVPYDFNPESIPQDGMEYLQHVVYERRNIKKCLTADIDTNIYRRNQTVTVPVNISINTYEKYLPSSDWQAQKIRDFQDFKQIVENKVCSDVRPTISSFNETEFIKTLTTKGPELLNFLKYKQSVKIRMLEIITNSLDSILNTWELEESVGEWIFAILATLSIPLSPNGCHVIREFTRKCREVRSKFPDTLDAKCCEPLNFYICICSKIYGQKDLSDSC